MHGDRFVGRIDPRMDRERGVLMIHALYAEPDGLATHVTARAAAKAIEELAEFLGAKDIEYDSGGSALANSNHFFLDSQ